MSIQRIVIAIDASPSSLAALETALDLAAALRVEVCGIFVEDINLLRLSSLPFAREVGTFSGAVRRLSTPDVERQLRLQAERAGLSLTAAARRRRVRAAFRVARGLVAEQLTAAVTAGDLLSVGTYGWSEGKRAGSTARFLARRAPGRVLILPRRARADGPAAVVYDGSRAGLEALEMAIDLVGGRGQDLRVLCVARGHEEAQRLARDAAAELGARGAGADYRRIDPDHLSQLARLAGGLGVNAMVVPATGRTPSEESIDKLVEEFPGPLLILRIE